jgi:large subunit ribosomal protein L21
MYAVIRAGGQQFKVSPGDIIRLTKSIDPASNGKVEFGSADVLAVSAEPGQINRPNGNGATVTAEVVDEGRSKKILVFHFKRKKQYKKLQGHRQAFTALRITEIAYDGQKFSAPELPAKKVKTKPASEGEASEHATAEQKTKKSASARSSGKHAKSAGKPHASTKSKSKKPGKK